ncbi:hypothetical protein GCM10009657_23220 [Oryzihumus leptocrescens]
MPPPGWSPPPGWAPDPSWPEPPHGWTWWRADPVRARGLATGWLVTLAVAAGVVVPALVVGLVVTVVMLGGSAGPGGCGPRDPATGAAAQLDLVNDTEAAVFLDDCQGQGCLLAESADRIAPDDDLVVPLSCSDGDVPETSWRIRSDDGEALGYLVISSPADADGATFFVTDASPDRRTTTSGE